MNHFIGMCTKLLDYRLSLKKHNGLGKSSQIILLVLQLL